MLESSQLLGIVCACAILTYLTICLLQEVQHKLRQDFLPTMGAEIAIWPAYQAVNFARVPVQHQLLMCSIGTLFDSSFLCW